MIERARRRGSISPFALLLAFRSALAIDLGALDDAEADARTALAAASEGGVETARRFARCHLALALVERGDLDAAAATVVPLSSDRAAFGAMPSLLLVEARLRRAQGDGGRALAAAREAAHGYEATGQRNPAIAPWRSEAALAALQLGDVDAARSLAGEEVRLAREWGAPSTLGRALRIAGLADGGEGGIALMREAVVVLAQSPARLERAAAHVELGAAVRRGGGRRESRALLRRGLELASACGARPLADRARHELRIAGARPRRERLHGPEALTPSERRVAALAAAGMSNRDIAQALFVTTKTVEVHLSSTYRKLDIGSRTQLGTALDPRPASEPAV